MNLNLRHTARHSPLGRGSSSSPKGMQQKWYDQATRTYYKLDSNGNHEGLVECIASELLANTTLEGTLISFVKYRLENLNGATVTVSDSFLERGERELSLRVLIDNDETLTRIDADVSIPVDTKILQIIRHVSEEFNLLELPKVYGTALLFDCLLLNEDRHWGNTSIVRGIEGYRVAPIFDVGNALRCQVGNCQHARDIYEPRPYNADQLYAISGLMGSSKVRVHYSAMDTTALSEYLYRFYPKIVVDGRLEVAKGLLDSWHNSPWSEFLEVL